MEGSPDTRSGAVGARTVMAASIGWQQIWPKSVLSYAWTDACARAAMVVAIPARVVARVVAAVGSTGVS